MQLSAVWFLGKLLKKSYLEKNFSHGKPLLQFSAPFGFQRNSKIVDSKLEGPTYLSNISTLLCVSLSLHT